MRYDLKTIGGAVGLGFLGDLFVRRRVDTASNLFFGGISQGSGFSQASCRLRA